MVIKAHILRNESLQGWREQIVGRWSYRQLAADLKWFHGWISFDAMAFNPGDGQNDNHERSSYLWSVRLD